MPGGDLEVSFLFFSLSLSLFSSILFFFLSYRRRPFVKGRREKKKDEEKERKSYKKRIREREKEREKRKGKKEN